MNNLFHAVIAVFFSNLKFCDDALKLKNHKIETTNICPLKSYVCCGNKWIVNPCCISLREKKMKVLIFFVFTIIEACWPIDLDSDIHIGERKSRKNGR